MLVKPGQLANRSKKFVINPLVDHVGHLVLLKPCLIDSALPQDRKSKPEFQLKIFFHAVESSAVWDATEVSLAVLGAISRDKDSSQVTNTTITTGAVHTVSLNANTTLKEESTLLADQVNQPPSAIKSATLNPSVNTSLTRSTPVTHTPSPTTLKRSKQKF